MTVVLGRVLEWIGVRSSTDHVVRDLKPMIDRLLYTIVLLKIKYSFNSSHELALDLNESGFPHAISIFQTVNDLNRKVDLARNVAGVETLKNILVDKLLTTGADTTEVLSDLSKSEYANLLDESRMFLPFTMGGLERLDSDDKEHRRYIFTWAVYGEICNMPYFHSLVFEQDSSREPLEDGGDDWKQFVDTVSFSSKHVPQIGVLIHQIDDHSNSIHPKFLERIQIGPLFTPLTSVSESGADFCELLRKYGGENDFVLELRSEKIISTGSKVTSGVFSRGGRVREVFFIPNDDRIAYENRATSVVRKLMLPHRVLQNINRTAEYFSPYKQHQTITYTQKGVLNVN